MDGTAPQAKVFVSCGQKDDEERVIAREIERLLVDKLHYDAYVAVEQHSLLGLRENIFEHLRTSEYFLFVDFCREEVSSAGDERCRGSLFCHQELALASFLELDALCFREGGALKLDGMMQAIQANPVEFSNRAVLVDLIRKSILAAPQWKPNWKNVLRMERDPAEYTDAQVGARGTGRFFHVRVANLNRWRPALGCYVYLDRIRRLPDGDDIPLRIVETKWAGYVEPTAVIRPAMDRQFDAVWIPHQASLVPQFSLFTDSGAYAPRFEGPGDFELTYVVSSENFPAVTGRYLLHLEEDLAKVRLEPGP